VPPAPAPSDPPAAPAPAAPRVVALGHSNRPLAEFLAMLREHGVRLLVDVRRHPGSRAVPWARGEALAAALAEAGIAYRHEPALGGRRSPAAGSPNTGWRNPQFRGYADHMASGEFQAALAGLLRHASREAVAVMCSEAVPWRCHRSLLADALVARGAEVVQAIAPGQAAPHRVTPFARIRDGQVTYPAERPLDVR
jgi:uncharacterized protein (DUF488 family)